MLIIKHTVETIAPASMVWQVWQNVASWNTWDHGIDFSTLEGPFQTGTTGTLKIKDGPLLDTQLTQVQPMKMFVQEAHVFLARFVMSHFVTEYAGKTVITVQTEIRGPLAYVWALLVAKSIKKKVPIEIAAMIKQAEVRVNGSRQQDSAC